MRWSGIRLGLVSAATLALSGCLNHAESTGGAVSRLLGDPGGALGFASADGETRPVASVAETTERPDGTASPIISSLQARESVLPTGSSYDTIALAVMASSARIAEAELQGARLRAQAAKYNWLPRIGPSISLTSLGDAVASMFIEQVLFDNGRKVAERDFARHDVELAAVGLAEDSNDRVSDALKLYLAAEEGRARVAIADRSLKDMGHFEWVMEERVKGGVSDRSDLDVLRQKLGEIRSDRATALADRRTAEAELAMMTGSDLSETLGLAELETSPGGVTPLPVLRAEAERDIAVAEAKIARAAHLPGLSASGTLTTAAANTGAIVATTEELLGVGTPASLRALEANKESATRKVRKAREDAARDIAALDAQAEGLAAQTREAEALARRAKANLDLFQAQYKAGARQVMDVVGVYETWADQSETAVTKRFALERLRIERARLLGLLVDGALM